MSFTQWLSMVVALAMASPAAAQTQVVQVVPDPTEIYIQNLLFSGTGCPEASVHGILDEDGNALTIRFLDFMAKDVVGGDGMNRRKSCEVLVDLHAPEGFAFAVTRIRTYGFAKLGSKSLAVQEVTLRFADDDPDKFLSFEKRLTGPSNGEFATSELISDPSLLWSPCGGSTPLNLSLNTTMSTNGQGTEAIIGVSPEMGRYEQLLDFLWKPCASPSGSPTPGPTPTKNQPPRVDAGKDLLTSATRPFDAAWKIPTVGTSVASGPSVVPVGTAVSPGGATTGTAGMALLEPQPAGPYTAWVTLGDALVGDDGLPLGLFTAQWRQLSGPCLVEIENRTLINSRFRIVQPVGIASCKGAHTLQLTAHDGEALTSDVRTITLQ